MLLGVLSLRSLRRSALALGLTGLLVRPFVDDLPWLYGAGLVMLLTYLVLLRPHRRHPAIFIVRRGRFVAPASPLLGIWVIAAGYSFPGLHPGLAIAAFLVAAVGSALPQVSLSPAGVDVRGLWRRHLPWSAFAPDNPPTPSRRARSVEIFVQRPNGSWRSEILRRGVRHIDDAFLARAMRQYVNNPKHRAEIGSVHELRRLRAVLSHDHRPATADPWLLPAD
jgi:hypothetical protein